MALHCDDPSCLTLPSPVTSRKHEILARRTLLAGPVWRVESLTVRYSPAASPSDRYIVRHPGAVVVLPVLDDGRFVIIRNHRIAIDQHLWELCAGTLEPGEDPAACAARELEEETGYRADSIFPLGTLYTTPGVTDQRMHVFLAQSMTFVGQRLMPDEDIVTALKSPGEVWSMIDRGELVDAKSIVALVMHQRRFGSA